MKLTKPLADGFHTLGHDQWTGKPDEQKVMKYWFIDVKVENGRISASKQMGLKEWQSENLPALVYEEEPNE